jgi:hypothetical protein
MPDHLNRKDPVRQIAYFTPDVRAAASGHAKPLGSDPYYIAENIPLSEGRYRGAPAEFLDIYKPGESGLHDVALIIDDQDATMKDYERAGVSAGLYAQVKNGAPFAMMAILNDRLRQYPWAFRGAL